MSSSSSSLPYHSVGKRRSRIIFFLMSWTPHRCFIYVFGLFLCRQKIVTGQKKKEMHLQAIPKHTHILFYHIPLRLRFPSSDHQQSYHSVNNFDDVAENSRTVRCASTVPLPGLYACVCSFLTGICDSWLLAKVAWWGREDQVNTCTRGESGSSGRPPTVRAASCGSIESSAE